MPLNAKKILASAIGIHATLFLYATLVGAIGTFGGLLETISWPIFSISALGASIVLAIVLSYAQPMVDRFI